MTDEYFKHQIKCRYCGKVFYSRWKVKIQYCSDECRTDYWNEQRKKSRVKRRVTKRCQVCGSQFAAKRKTAKYCSSACRQAQYRHDKKLQ